MSENGSRGRGGPLIVPPTDLVDHVQRLHEASMYLTAWQQAEAFAPIRQWDGTPARIMAARLASCLGNQKLSDAMIHLAWKRDPNDPRALCYSIPGLARIRGFVHVMRLYRSHPDGPPGAEPKIVARWLNQFATYFGILRDLTTAERLVKQSIQVYPNHPGAFGAHAYAYYCSDDLPRALEILDEAVSINEAENTRYLAWLRARILIQMSREEEAVEYLSFHAPRYEDSTLYQYLGQGLSVLKRHEECIQAQEMELKLLPLATQEIREFYYGSLANYHYLCGRRDRALEYARQSKIPVMVNLTTRLEEAGDRPARRVELPVGFVHQHQLTCAPASLAIIGQYWKDTVDHLEIAEEICYIGTPDHKIMDWLRSHGWIVRMLVPTVDSVRALLDRGVPLGLLTSASDSGHMQTLHGYDDIYGSFLIQDPSSRHYSEVLADSFLDSYKGYEARALAIVPESCGELLDGLEFPEGDILEATVELHRFLSNHRRSEAQAHLNSMAATHGDHVLVWECRENLASYDNNLGAALAATEAQLALFPDKPRLAYRKLSYLERLERNREAARYAAELSQQDSPDPAALEVHIRYLLQDARKEPQLRRRLRQLAQIRPTGAELWHLAAQFARLEGRTEDYRENSRISVCLEDKNERYAVGYFRAARATGQADQAIEYLRTRFELYGSKSPDPAITLARALVENHQIHDVEELLNQALHRLPGNSQLHLYAADHALDLQRLAKAREHLSQGEASGYWRRIHELRVRLAFLENQWQKAREECQKILDRSPEDVDTHAMMATAISRLESPKAASAYLIQTADRHPDNLSLRHMALVNCRDPEAALIQAEAYLSAAPEDPAALREMAKVLRNLRRYEEALANLDRSALIDPEHSQLDLLRANTLKDLGRVEEARESIRRCLRLCVDNRDAIDYYWFLAATEKEERECIETIFEEIRRQVTDGTALERWTDLAESILSLDEIVERLRDALKSRPDLPGVWCQLIAYLRASEKDEEAAELTRKAATKFPLSVPVQRLAAAAFRSKSREEAVQEYRKVYDMAPRFVPAILEYAIALTRADRLEEARQVLEIGMGDLPYSGDLKFQMAQTLIAMGRKSDAVSWMVEGLRQAPENESATGQLHNLLKDLNRSAEFEPIIRSLAEERWDDSYALRGLAMSLANDQVVLKVDLLKRALQLNPSCERTADMLVYSLTQRGDFDEAQSVLARTLDRFPTMTLRTREAQVAAAMGRYAEAVRLVRQICQEWPRALWPRELLQYWLKLMGKHGESAMVCRELIQIQPRYADGYSSLAESLQQTNQTDEALENWEKAVELSLPDPKFVLGYVYALQTARKDELALTVLDKVPESSQDPDQDLARIFSLLRRLRTNEALKSFEKMLARTTALHSNVVANALDQFKDEGLGKSATQLLAKSILSQPQNPPSAQVACWAKQVSTGQASMALRYKVWRVLNRLSPFHPARIRDRISRVPHGGISLRTLRRMLKNPDHPMVSDLSNYHRMAHALRDKGLLEHVVLWLSDAHHRPGIPMATCAFVPDCLMMDRNGDQACRAALEIVESVPADDSYPYLACYGILHLSLTGKADDLERATAIVSEIDGIDFDEVMEPMRRTARAIHELAKRDPNLRKSQVGKVVRELAVLRKSSYLLIVEFVRYACRRAGWKFGGLFGWFRAVLRTM